MLSLKMATSGGEKPDRQPLTPVHNMLLDWCPDLASRSSTRASSCAVPPTPTPSGMGRSAVIGKRPRAFCYENGWAQTATFQHGYLRRAAELGEHDHQPEKQEARARCLRGPSSNHPDVMLKMMLEPGDFQFHQQPHDPATAEAGFRRIMPAKDQRATSLPAMDQRAGVAAHCRRRQSTPGGRRPWRAWDALAEQHRAATAGAGRPDLEHDPEKIARNP